MPVLMALASRQGPKPPKTAAISKAGINNNKDPRPNAGGKYQYAARAVNGNAAADR